MDQKVVEDPVDQKVVEDPVGLRVVEALGDPKVVADLVDPKVVVDLEAPRVDGDLADLKEGVAPAAPKEASLAEGALVIEALARASRRSCTSTPSPRASTRS